MSLTSSLRHWWNISILFFISEVCSKLRGNRCSRKFEVTINSRGDEVDRVFWLNKLQMRKFFKKFIATVRRRFWIWTKCQWKDHWTRNFLSSGASKVIFGKMFRNTEKVKTGLFEVFGVKASGSKWHRSIGVDFCLLLVMKKILIAFVTDSYS